MLELLLVSAILCLGSAIQASVGIGAGLFAAPLVALVDTRFLPGPILAAVFVLTLLITARDRQSMDVRGVGWALLGRVPGVVIGAWVAVIATRSWLELTLGSMILLCVAISISPWSLSPSRRHLLAAGLISGVTGTATSVGGPPVALVYQHADGPTLRATMSGYFVVGTALSLVVLAFAGRFGHQELLDSAALVPAVLLGFLVSLRTVRVFDRGYTRHAVLLISGLASLALIVRGLARLL